MSELIATVEETVAEAEDAVPAQLPPLEEWVGPETLQALEDGAGPRSVPITFDYLWYTVMVLSPSEIILDPG